MDNKNLSFGFIVINKDIGPTSHDIVNKLRRITGIKKIGHAGTLDPAASGVLVMAIGRGATKQIDTIVKKDKEYIAEFTLGFITDTYDGESAEQEYFDFLDRLLFSKFKKKRRERLLQSLNKERIEKVVKKFIGKQKQIPPMYSAKKVGGKKLYELARAGKKIKRKASNIEIYNIEILDFAWPKLKLRIECSTGTYIRSLARDMGRRLGCGAYMSVLQRTRVGEFNISRSVGLSDLNKENWQGKLLEIEL